MRVAIQVALGLVIVAAAVRAAFFLAYAANMIGLPLEVYYLEAKSAYLSWRVAAGEPLYPEWRSYPHVTNFFGPLYFLIVGGLARLAGAGMDGIYAIGRWTTLVAGLMAAAVAGVATARREGRGAGAFAALLAIGGAPMVGFGVMTRPDVLADLLGLAGFLLAVDRRGRWRAVAGGTLLVASAFTKQPAALYLGAAALGLIADGRWRRGLALAASTAAAILAIVAVVTLTVEPRFAVDLLGERETPWAPDDWRVLLWRLMKLGREIPVLTAVGLLLWAVRPGRDPLVAGAAVALLALSTAGLLVSTGGYEGLGRGLLGAVRSGEWLEATGPLALAAFPAVMGLAWAAVERDRPRDRPLAVLAVVLLVGSTVSALKFGADLNYFLAPRLAAALAGGALWGAAARLADRRPGEGVGWHRQAAVAAAVLYLAYGLYPGIEHLRAQYREALVYSRGLDVPGFRKAMAERRSVERIAGKADVLVLSDSGTFNARLGVRAPFVDPWLFRVLVTSGRVDPALIRRRLEGAEYDLIVTTKDLYEVGDIYDRYAFGLAPELAEIARRRYAPAGEAGGQFLYVPREEAE